MATQALAVSDQQQLAQPLKLNDIQHLAAILTKSGYFQDAREQAQAAVKVLAGQELGIPPIAAMMGINIVRGKVELGGNLIASRIIAHGYKYLTKQLDNSGCALIFLGRVGDPAHGLGVSGGRPILGDSVFTQEDAKAAELTGKDGDMYKKYPRNMLFNRAISNGAKWYTPDIFSGIPVYAQGELTGSDVGGVVEITKQPQMPEAESTKQVEIVEQQAKVEAKPTATKGFDAAKARELIKPFEDLIGHDDFMRILGNEGFTSLADIWTRQDATRVYKLMEMEVAAQRQQARESDMTEQAELIGAGVPYAD